jgi:radical SAM protein with 4Fe4S-binding SPASM domain
MPDLRETRLTCALSDSLYMKRIETPVSELLRHQKKCRDCEHRIECGGGCRAAALIDNGGSDYLGIDPVTCYFFKNGYEGRIDEIAAKHNASNRGSSNR